MNWAVHVLSGNEKGKEFPVPDGEGLVLGRTLDHQIVMGSPDAAVRHAVVSVLDGRLFIKDSDSGLGTLVNGQKITEAELKEGDRIRIGKVSMMIITLTRFSPAVSEMSGGTQFLFKSPQSSTPASTPGRALNGSLKEVSLSDLLQFLTQSRKDGVLRLDLEAGSTGKIHVREGRIVYATWTGQAPVGPARILFRLFRQTAGTFEFCPPEKHKRTEEIQQSADSLLLEGIQEGDEIRGFLEKLPPLISRIRTSPPKGGLHLSDLSPEELLVLETTLDWPTLQELIDRHPTSDLEALRHLTRLLNAGIVAPLSGP